MSGHDDFDFEPIPGVPAPLPAGEHIVWQGSPDARALAMRALHVRKLSWYFGALLVLRCATVYGGGASVADALLATAKLVPLALVALALLGGFAWLAARSTIYTITSRRVLMRFGVALPMTVNVPFRIVESAALRMSADGTGDIPLALAGDDRIAYLHLWPHARPGFYTRPQPMLRALPDARRVAELLVQAIAGEAPKAAVAPAPAAAPAPSQELAPALS